jgi:CheY-like chemotaxis protein
VILGFLNSGGISVLTETTIRVILPPVERIGRTGKSGRTPTAQGGAILLASLARQPHRSVLIVDESEDSREVLRAALELRGMCIYEAGSARQGLEMARRHQPGVIVLDLEAETPDDDAIRRQYGDESHSHQSSLVVLGTARFDQPNLPRAQIVSKPYHYAPLIRTIERLLERVITAEPGEL